MDLRFRAAFRSALAALGREGRPREIRVRLQRRRLPSVDLTLAMAALDLPGEPPHVLVASSTVPPSVPVPPSPEADVAREDLLSSFARLLLSAEFTLGRAAVALLDAPADGILVDLHDDEGNWRRAVTLARDDAFMESDLPVAGRGKLQRQVLESGRPVVESSLEDLDVLGTDAAGVSLAARLGAGSLVCLPLATATRPWGTVTLVRRSGERRPFSLAEAGLLRELCDQFALRLDMDPRAAASR